LVTDRGRIVAEIVPAGQAPDRYEDHPVLARGIREGWIAPAKDPDSPLPPRKPVPGYTLKQLLADLDRDREDRCLLISTVRSCSPSCLLRIGGPATASGVRFGFQPPARI
jgi:antitoxin (DNA-binding transcriptional repressor) of toxin-antitoxin stability system